MGTSICKGRAIKMNLKLIIFSLIVNVAKSNVLDSFGLDSIIDLGIRLQEARITREHCHGERIQELGDLEGHFDVLKIIKKRWKAIKQCRRLRTTPIAREFVEDFEGYMTDLGNAWNKKFKCEEICELRRKERKEMKYGIWA